MTEFWTQGPPKDYKTVAVPTAANGGQLRLTREGGILHHLVADEPDHAFREIRQTQLGAEDLAHVRLEVIDSGVPGVDVDIRLVDLRIRSGNAASITNGELTQKAGVPSALPTTPAPEVEEKQGGGRRGWLAAGIVLAMVVIVSFILTVWLWRRGQS